MQSRAVVKAHDIFGHIHHCLVVVGVVLLPNPLPLQVEEETLTNSVISSVTFTAHAANQAMLCQQSLMQGAGLLGGFIRYSERLDEAGIEPSVGSRGDSYDNALAETINGLYMLS